MGIRYWWRVSITAYLLWTKDSFPAESRWQGLLFIGFILGTLLSEILFSGALGDKIMLKYVARNGGVRMPEFRLLLIIPAAVIAAGKIQFLLSFSALWVVRP